MIDPVADPAKAFRPPSALSEEQRLCNDALDSREFDSISDDQWVALCERVALEARQVDETEAKKESEE